MTNMKQSRDILKKLLDKRIVCILGENVSEIEVDTERCDKENCLMFHRLINSYQIANIIGMNEYNYAFESLVKYGYLPIRVGSVLYDKMIKDNLDLIEVGRIDGY